MRLHPIAAALFLCASCSHDQYRVELEPDGPEIVRTLSMWSVGGEGGPSEKSFPPELAERLASAYGSDPGESHSLTGRFGSRLPDDVGGAGSWSHWPTRFGAARLYVERFRGRLDPLGEVEEIERSVDTAVDLALDWVGFELDGHGDRERLERFVDGDLRRDLKNLALYARLIAYDPEGSFDEERSIAWGITALQMLSERGYFRADELPELARSITTVDSDPVRSTAFLRRMLARGAGFDDESLPDALSFLETPERAGASLQSWAASSGADFEERAGRVLEDLFTAFFPFGLFDERDGVVVELRTGIEPLHTNGQFDPGRGVTVWDEARIHAERGAPAMRYAAWAEPDRGAQLASFGEVVLEGEALWSYAQWRHALEPAFAAEWDLFVGTLRPGRDLEDRLRTFGEGIDGDASAFRREGVDALLTGLGFEVLDD